MNSVHMEGVGLMALLHRASSNMHRFLFKMLNSSFFSFFVFVYVFIWCLVFFFSFACVMIMFLEIYLTGTIRYPSS